MNGPKARELPPLPHALLDPRPVLALGTIAWTLAALALMLTDAPTRQIALCFAGIGVGAAGTAVYILQRRAVARGAAGAQDGLATEDRRDNQQQGRVL